MCGGRTPSAYRNPAKKLYPQHNYFRVSHLSLSVTVSIYILALTHKICGILSKKLQKLALLKI